MTANSEPKPDGSLQGSCQLIACAMLRFGSSSYKEVLIRSFDLVVRIRQQDLQSHIPVL